MGQLVLWSANLDSVLPCSGYILKGWHATTLGGQVGVRCEGLQNICLPQGQENARVIL